MTKHRDPSFNIIIILLVIAITILAVFFISKVKCEAVKNEAFEQGKQSRQAEVSKWENKSLEFQNKSETCEDEKKEVKKEYDLCVEEKGKLNTTINIYSAQVAQNNTIVENRIKNYFKWNNFTFSIPLFFSLTLSATITGLATTLFENNFKFGKGKPIVIIIASLVIAFIFFLILLKLFNT